MPKSLPPIVAAIALLSSASAMADGHTEPAPTGKQVLMPEEEGPRAFMEEFGFSEAVIHGDTVYLSGVIVGSAKDEASQAAAFDGTFDYLGKVLERAGSSWDDVLEITSFHTDIEQSAPAFMAARNKVIKAPFPAWTAIDVDRLYTPDGIVEIKIVARVSPVK